MDVARSAIRLAKKPHVLYRRTRDEMPAFNEEIEETIEEGVAFTFLVDPVRVHRSGGVKRLECLRMELGEKDETGRRKPRPVAGSNFFIEADSIVVAAGEEIDVSLLSRGIERRDGIVLTLTGGKTPAEGIFAGGDLASKDRTVAYAIGSGKKAAVAIDCYLREKDAEKAIQALLIGNGTSVSILPYRHPGGHLRSSHVVSFEELNMDYFEISKRATEEKCPLPERIKGFREGTFTLTEQSALGEAGRCFNCGTCNECENCYTFCPDASILKGAKQLSREVDYDFCKGCGICFTECPRRAISLQEEAR